jgi:hypothetical protein
MSKQEWGGVFFIACVTLLTIAFIVGPFIIGKPSKKNTKKLKCIEHHGHIECPKK